MLIGVFMRYMRPIHREKVYRHLFTVCRPPSLRPPFPRDGGLYTFWASLLSVEHTDGSVFFTEYLPERCL